MKTIVKLRVLLFIAFAVVTVFFGLCSRSEKIPLPGFVYEYGGDTLWAMAVFWAFCVFAPLARTWKISLAAVLFSFGIEFSQFYHAPWIEGVRATRLGGLVLGFGFKFSDLVCYTAGILLAGMIHYLLSKNQSNKAIPPKK